MVCARTRAVERHTYEDIDACGFSDASVGAVRAGPRLPIQVDDQVIIADSESLAEHPAGGLDAYHPVSAGLIARPTRYRFPVHVTVHSCLAKIAGRTLKSSQAGRQELKGAIYFSSFRKTYPRTVLVTPYGKVQPG